MDLGGKKKKKGPQIFGVSVIEDTFEEPVPQKSQTQFSNSEYDQTINSLFNLTPIKKSENHHITKLKILQKEGHLK